MSAMSNFAFLQPDWPELLAKVCRAEGGRAGSLRRL